MNIKTLHVSKIKNTHRLIIIVTFIMIGLFIFTFLMLHFIKYLLVKSQISKQVMVKKSQTSIIILTQHIIND